MSSSYTYSDSYTVVDVRKVMGQLHADMRMIAQSTGFETQDNIDSIMHDVAQFAESEYMDRVQIRLVGSNGKNVKVWEYDIKRNVAGLSSDHAGGNLSNVAAVRMAITATFSQVWQALSSEKQAAFRSRLNWPWPTTTDDLSVAHLQVADERTYSSNGYGAKRSVYN
jgi:hypothetical protein